MYIFKKYIYLIELKCYNESVNWVFVRRRNADERGKMVKTIIKDPLLLKRKAAAAEKTDSQIGEDLLETLFANRERCAGMAANMIGVNKCIICFAEENGTLTLMYNPKIVSAFGEYEAEEGCLSLSGARKARRFKFITVRFFDRLWNEKTENYSGFTAEVIQHEINHLEGILI